MQIKFGAILALSFGILGVYAAPAQGTPVAILPVTTSIPTPGSKPPDVNPTSILPPGGTPTSIASPPSKPTDVNTPPGGTPTTTIVTPTSIATPGSKPPDVIFPPGISCGCWNDCTLYGCGPDHEVCPCVPSCDPKYACFSFTSTPGAATPPPTL